MRRRSSEGRAAESEVPRVVTEQQGVEGLDLHDTTHLIILDKILDKSVLRQLVSRGHRLGARAPLQVYQLVMRNTIEHLMLHFDGNDDDDEVGGGEGKEDEDEETHWNRRLAESYFVSETAKRAWRWC